jgi:DNA adenine methylase
LNPSPFVKWAGGKTQLLPQYEPYFPATFGRYIEPFVGGGAVFFYLYRQGRLAGKKVLLMDHLEELINCYRVIQNQVEGLLNELKSHESHKQSSDYFYEVRYWDRQSGYARRSDVQRAARFIYLNRTCYNGLYRVPGDLFYLDPPYHPLSATASFTSYTSTDFGAEDQRRLAGLFQELDHHGCQVMLSNSSTDLIRELYDGYDQVPAHATRAISSKGNRRGAVPELLVMNRYERL